MPGVSREKRETLLSLSFIAAMIVLCAALAVLQYRWVGEISAAAHERLKGSLQSSLNHLSLELNSEVTAVCRLFLPTNAQSGLPGLEQEIAERYGRLARFNRNARLFTRIALVSPQGNSVRLRILDVQAGKFVDAAWPDNWKTSRQRIESRARRQPWMNDQASPEQSLVFELPLFRLEAQAAPRSFGPPPDPVTLIVELNPSYLAKITIPELLNLHLSDGKALEYYAAVFTRSKTPVLLYESDPGVSKTIVSGADASADLLDIDFRQLNPRPDLRSAGPGGSALMLDPGPMPPGPERMPGRGRCQIFVRHRAGSLEAVVSRARRRNLGAAGAVLLLLMASLAALIRFTRRAQKLAQIQMQFVAGVSHELRTPLTVIHTAGYNLRGGLAHNPAQVERYGALIQQESGRLKELVEQILRFARTQAGQVMQTREPISVAEVVQGAVDAERSAVHSAGCELEASIDQRLPLVLGDSLALRHALQNLLNNAVKYGTEGSNWIGVSAVKVEHEGSEWIEIRVADHGPGIPANEQHHIFDPFFRGRRAREDQIHGSGLGLNLVMSIVRAHGGTIEVKSETMKGAEFIIRLPAAAPELQDEFANSID